MRVLMRKSVLFLLLLVFSGQLHAQDSAQSGLLSLTVMPGISLPLGGVLSILVDEGIPYRISLYATASS